MQLLGDQGLGFETTQSGEKIYQLDLKSASYGRCIGTDLRIKGEGKGVLPPVPTDLRIEGEVKGVLPPSPTPLNSKASISK